MTRRKVAAHHFYEIYSLSISVTRVNKNHYLVSFDSFNQNNPYPLYAFRATVPVSEENNSVEEHDYQDKKTGLWFKISESWGEVRLNQDIKEIFSDSYSVRDRFRGLLISQFFPRISRMIAQGKKKRTIKISKKSINPRKRRRKRRVSGKSISDET